MGVSAAGVGKKLRTAWGSRPVCVRLKFSPRPSFLGDCPTGFSLGAASEAAPRENPHWTLDSRGFFLVSTPQTAIVGTDVKKQIPINNRGVEEGGVA